MAWMRTSVSLYTFGFSITKFAEYLRQEGQEFGSSGAPPPLGHILIAMGIVAIILAVLEHSKRIRRMQQLGLPDASRWYLPTVAAFCLFVVGIVTLVGITLSPPA